LARNANEKEAAMYATILLESYHGTAATQGDATILLRQFVDLFMHYPPASLKKMVSPYDGLPSRTEWKPSLKAAKEFLDDHVTWIKNQRDSAKAAIAKPPEPEKPMLTDTQKAALDEKLAEVKRRLSMASASDPIYRGRHADKSEIDPEKAGADGVE
jgi:hypothetical protein